LKVIMRKEFDTFLHAAILDEESGACLTMLSLLVRRNLDPWEEAARYALSPGEASIAKLSDLLEGVAPWAGPDGGARAAAVRLLKLLPAAPPIDSLSSNPMWPVLKRLLEQLKYVSELWIRNDRR
jgi:hypothetical protein